MAGDRRTHAPATIIGLHAASNEDEVDPIYNTRIAEVYKDRAGWDKELCSDYFSSTTLSMPISDNLYRFKVFTERDPIHIPYSLATHTIN
jgi:hypothetical protein